MNCNKQKKQLKVYKHKIKSVAGGQGPIVFLKRAIISLLF